MTYRTNTDAKFDFQLGEAFPRETRAAELFNFKKFELKSETFLWYAIGNLCIEMESYGKPSGILATEADWWMHELVREDTTSGFVILPTWRLRMLATCERAEGKAVRGGDNRGSLMVNLPLARFPW